MPGRELTVSPCMYLLDAHQALTQRGFEQLLHLTSLVLVDEDPDVVADGALRPGLYLCSNRRLPRFR
jgi:hypothetical protein